MDSHSISHAFLSDCINEHLGKHAFNHGIYHLIIRCLKKFLVTNVVVVDLTVIAAEDVRLQSCSTIVELYVWSGTRLRTANDDDGL